MPRAAIERGFAMRVIPLHLIASALQSICAGGSWPSNLDMAPVMSGAASVESALRRRSS
jgi:hypothetical protein